MKFKASSNPTIDNVPKVPGAYKEVADQGAWLDKDTKAAPAISWWVNVGNLNDIKEIAEKSESTVFVLMPPDDRDPTLHVDSRAEIDMTDGVPESVVEQHKDNPTLLFGGQQQRGPTQDDLKNGLKVQALDAEGKKRGDEALARAGEELERTAEERQKEHQTLADEVTARLMGSRFVEDVKAVSTRTMLRTYLHEKDPKFAEALEDRLARLTALDALDDGTLDAEVLKTVEWMKTVGVSQDRMFALLLRGLLLAVLQNRKLDDTQ